MFLDAGNTRSLLSRIQKNDSRRMQVAATDTLLSPETCVMLLVDFQAGLGFGVESASRQVLLNNAVALARTAAASAFLLSGMAFADRARGKR